MRDDGWLSGEHRSWFVRWTALTATEKDIEAQLCREIAALAQHTTLGYHGHPAAREVPPTPVHTTPEAMAGIRISDSSTSTALRLIAHNDQLVARGIEPLVKAPYAIDIFLGTIPA